MYDGAVFRISIEEMAVNKDDKDDKEMLAYYRETSAQQAIDISNLMKQVKANDKTIAGIIKAHEEYAEGLHKRLRVEAVKNTEDALLKVISNLIGQKLDGDY